MSRYRSRTQQEPGNKQFAKRSGNPAVSARAKADIEHPQRSSHRMTRTGQAVPMSPLDHRPAKQVGGGRRLGGCTVTHPSRYRDPRGLAPTHR